MKHRSQLRWIFLLVAITTFSALVQATRSPRPEPSAAAETWRAEPSLEPLPEPFPEAAIAFRQGGLSAALAVLAPFAADQLGPLPINLVLGLYAHAGGDMRLAREYLETSIDPSGTMEDWRLLLLADAMQAEGDSTVADRALEELLVRHPTSPIRPWAALLWIEMARTREEWDSALERIDHLRQQPLPPTTLRDLEIAAWEIGETLERPDLRAVAAHRLLVSYPLDASKLKVVEVFREPGGELFWNSILTDEELLERARNLLAADLAESALEMIDQVSEEARTAEWILLRAQALTSNHQGIEALSELKQLSPEDPAENVEVAWRRALAALDAATARRGRVNLPLSQRQQLRRLALGYLELVVDLDADPQRTQAALERIFQEQADEEESFEEALSTLRRLRRLVPTDTTGAKYLWQLGWKSFQSRNFSGAIGLWGELTELYPESSYSRSGHYWSGRAYESLGDTRRAHSIYRQIGSSASTDYYRQHAMMRLESTGIEPDPAPRLPTESWPRDTALARAQWLHELGLDKLALQELEGLEGRVERRAHCALEAKVLAGLDRRRDSIVSLVCAFPALGKPLQATVPDDAQRLYYPLDFREVIEQRSRERSLSPELVFAMIRQESAFDVSATSRAGARGLMQMMPATGRELATRLGLPYSTDRLADPDYNLRLGTLYIRQVLDMFDGNVELALAGYNGGPYRIKRLWRQAGAEPELDRFIEGLSLEETKTYVKRIILFSNSYRNLYNEPG